jgi:hypothetical protein
MSLLMFDGDGTFMTRGTPGASDAVGDIGVLRCVELPRVVDDELNIDLPYDGSRSVDRAVVPWRSRYPSSRDMEGRSRTDKGDAIR